MFSKDVFDNNDYVATYVDDEHSRICVESMTDVWICDNQGNIIKGKGICHLSAKQIVLLANNNG